jgi:hypothetical protein
VSNTRFTLAAVALLAAPVLAGCGSESSTAAATNHADHGSMPSAASEASPSETASATTSASPTEAQPEGTTIRISVTDGKVTPPALVEQVGLGESVTLVVTSDVADEVHLHGYDAHADLVAGQEGTLTFTADIPGVFEVELEETGTLLVELEVK